MIFALRSRWLRVLCAVQWDGCQSLEDAWSTTCVCRLAAFWIQCLWKGFLAHWFPLTLAMVLLEVESWHIQTSPCPFFFTAVPVMCYHFVINSAALDDEWSTWAQLLRSNAISEASGSCLQDGLRLPTRKLLLAWRCRRAGTWGRILCRTTGEFIRSTYVPSYVPFWYPLTLVMPWYQKGARASSGNLFKLMPFRLIDQLPFQRFHAGVSYYFTERSTGKMHCSWVHVAMRWLSGLPGRSVVSNDPTCESNIIQPSWRLLFGVIDPTWHQEPLVLGDRLGGRLFGEVYITRPALVSQLQLDMPWMQHAWPVLKQTRLSGRRKGSTTMWPGTTGTGLACRVSARIPPQRLRSKTLISTCVKHISKSKCTKHTSSGWKLRCRKSACRCGAKDISKSKCEKHGMLRPVLDVQMSFRVAGARDCGPCQK